MKKAFTCSLAILVIAALASAGGGPAKDAKRYQQWNDEDIQKVFTDSPWSRKVTVEGTWKPVQGS